MTSTGETPIGGVDGMGPTWRQLSPHLWVGRDGTTVLGTIERGARFVFIDAEGAPHEGFRTLREAQDAATGPIRIPMRSAPPAAAPRPGRPIRTVILVVGILLVACACWWIGSELLLR